MIVSMAVWFIMPSVYAADAELIWGSQGEFINMLEGNTQQDTIKHDMYYSLEKHLKKLAKKLPAEQLLRVNITSIDLAGNIFMTQSGQMQRILGETDSPSISFTYQLFDKNKNVIDQGDKNISNVGYMNNTPNNLINKQFGYEMFLFNIFFRKHTFNE